MSAISYVLVLPFGLIPPSLLRAARAAVKPGASGFVELVSEILRQHVEATAALTPEAAVKLAKDFTQECNHLQNFLAQLPNNGKLDPESEDRVVCVGEKFSAQYLTALLKDKGTRAEYVDLSHIVPLDSTNVSLKSSCASPSMSPQYFETLSDLVRRRIEACGNRVPVK